MGKSPMAHHKNTSVAQCWGSGLSCALAKSWKILVFSRCHPTKTLRFKDLNTDLHKGFMQIVVPEHKYTFFLFFFLPSICIFIRKIYAIVWNLKKVKLLLSKVSCILFLFNLMSTIIFLFFSLFKSISTVCELLHIIIRNEISIVS